MQINRRRFLAISAAAGTLAFGNPASAAPYRWQGTALGAKASLLLHHPDKQQAARIVSACVAEISRLENIFSLYRQESALVQLNSQGFLDHPPLELVQALADCRRISDITGGAFDVTVQPLWQLYAGHFSSIDPDPQGPSADKIALATSRIDYRKIAIGSDRIEFGTPGMAITLNGIDLSGIKPGQTAAVFGPGPIGLLTVQLLKAAGAGQIIVTGTSADGRRLDIAQQLGADIIIDVEKEDPVKQVRKVAGHLDFVFEATGIPQTISQGLQMLKNGGKVMIIGIHARKATFDPIDLVRRSKSLIGVYGYDRNTWLRALTLMSAGKINLDPIITHRLPFSQGVKGFELAVSKTAAKVVFGPEA